jgi:hypothetical protein
MPLREKKNINGLTWKSSGPIFQLIPDFLTFFYLIPGDLKHGAIVLLGYRITLY